MLSKLNFNFFKYKLRSYIYFSLESLCLFSNVYSIYHRPKEFRNVVPSILNELRLSIEVLT